MGNAGKKVTQVLDFPAFFAVLYEKSFCQKVEKTYKSLVVFTRKRALYKVRKFAKIKASDSLLDF